MQSSFHSLGFGMVLAVLLVYALLVVLFQSWVDPLIIMMAVPGALMGILWMLALTSTTINVESLMGAIMSIGISVSNSILVVSFANDLRAREEVGPLRAVIEAGRIRLRPVLMRGAVFAVDVRPDLHPLLGLARCLRRRPSYWGLLPNTSVAILPHLQRFWCTQVGNAWLKH